MSRRKHNSAYRPAILRLSKTALPGLLLFAALLWGTCAHGQNRQQLEQKRQQLLREIRETELALDETKENKNATLEQYLALKRQIRNRQELMTTLKTEIGHVARSIERSEEVLNALELDIEKLKAEYAHTIRGAYRHHLSNSMLIFLFSADSFNDAFQRWQYIRQYDRFRKKQAYNILQTQAMLAERAQGLEARKLEQERLLITQQQQQALLSRELQDKDQLLAQLNSNEQELMSALNEQQQAHEQLNQAIEDIIVAEIAKKRRASRESLTAAGASSEGPAEPEMPKVSPASSPGAGTDFAQIKGQFPWPVRSGRISKPFGQVIEVEDTGLKLPNNGIEIETEPQARVFPVHPGEVTHITFVPVYQNAVLLNHGDYYTLYYRIEEVFVKKGDFVGPESPIGRLGPEKTAVHFEIWKGTQKLDPSQWLKKR